jgi:intracellular multiplication protein IcmC
MDVYSMLANLEKSLPGIQNVISYTAYFIGICLVMMSLYKLHHVADQRNMMSQQHSISGPIVTIIAGAFLIYLPSTIDTMTATFWGTDSPMAFDTTTGGQYDQMIGIVLKIVKIVGIIAFIRGWLMIAKSTDQGQQGGVGKGMTHIIGGLLAFHMEATLQVLQNTFIGG